MLTQPEVIVERLRLEEKRASGRHVKGWQVETVL